MIDPRPYWYATRAYGLQLDTLAAQGRLVAMNYGEGDLPFFDAAGPATEAILQHAEGQMGTEIPSTLRAFFKTCTQKFSARWAFAHHRYEQNNQRQTIIDSVAPPEFMRDEVGWLDKIERQRPIVGAGRFEISVLGMLRAFDARKGWVDMYRTRSGDADTDAHFNGVADFMEAGFPFATAPNGDWLAIDLRDGCQQLMHVSHEGEEAGIEIAQTFPQFMLQQAMLGFIGFDFPEVFRFSGNEVHTSDTTPYISEVNFDARDGKNPIWTDWFWNGFARPVVPDEMLEIVTCNLMS